MDSEVIAAIIALSGAILSIGISLFISLGTSRYNYNKLFAKTVSESRNKWLNEMRDFISTMLAEVKNPCPLGKDKDICKNAECQLHSTDTRTNKYWKARNEIMLRLNLNEPLHLMLKNEILQLDNSKDDKDDKTVEKIILISQSLLKEEWEKVKKEAKGE